MPLTQFREAEPLPAVYRLLATLPPGPVVELPYWYERMDFPRHAYYMLNSTAHWMPLVNGYSDHIPQDFRDTVIALCSFPTRESFRILGERDARYAIFHLNMYNARLAPAAARASRDLLAVPASADARRGRVALRNRRLAELGLFVALALAAHLAARLRSGASFAPRQRRHRLQHLGRRVGAASAPPRSAAPVRGADLLSRARHAGVLGAHGGAEPHGSAAHLDRRVAGARLQPARPRLASCCRASRCAG